MKFGWLPPTTFICHNKMLKIRRPPSAKTAHAGLAHRLGPRFTRSLPGSRPGPVQACSSSQHGPSISSPAGTILAAAASACLLLAPHTPALAVAAPPQDSLPALRGPARVVDGDTLYIGQVKVQQAFSLKQRLTLERQQEVLLQEVSVHGSLFPSPPLPAGKDQAVWGESFFVRKS